jgi:hypothetical protein
MLAAEQLLVFEGQSERDLPKINKRTIREVNRLMRRHKLF